jgi:hypothetical protein
MPSKKVLSRKKSQGISVSLPLACLMEDSVTVQLHYTIIVSVAWY